MEVKQLARVLYEPMIAVNAAFEPPETQKKYNDLLRQLDDFAHGRRIKPKSLIGVVQVMQQQVEEVGHLDSEDAEKLKAALIRQVKTNMGNGPRPVEREVVEVQEKKETSTKRKHKKH